MEAILAFLRFFGGSYDMDGGPFPPPETDMDGGPFPPPDKG
jgi:hypothetical protein